VAGVPTFCIPTDSDGSADGVVIGAEDVEHGE
jgi:hypothetical protein